MSEILQDFRFGLRTLVRAPAFTLVAIATLGLGIGVSVAMFGVLDAAVIRPLSFPDPGRLVIGRRTLDGQMAEFVSGADYIDYRDQGGVFEHLAAILPDATESTVTGEGEPERIAGTTVSVNFLPTLGIVPDVGRNFTTEEGQAGAPSVVLVSHAYWQRVYDGSSMVAGRSLIVDGTPYAIVGVMPPDFHLLVDVDFWLPMRPDRDMASTRDRHNWFLVGRLRKGVTPEAAQSRVDVISANLAAAYPATNEGKGLVLSDLQGMLVEGYRARLYILTGAIVLVLLIACANLAGMLLAREPARRMELSVRAALGAGRSRMTRQLLSESALLAAGGGAVGVALAVWFQQAILDFLQMQRLGLHRAEISVPMVLLALVLSMMASLAAGAYPALRAARIDLARDLRAGTPGGGGSAFRGGLVVVQVALAVVLLIGSGLMIRSFSLTRDVSPGFDARRVLTATIPLPRTQYPDPRQRTGFYSSLLNAVRAAPGVAAAGAVNFLPINQPRDIFRVSTRADPEHPERVFLRSVMAGYLETMGIPLLLGRDFDTTDERDAPRVAILSEALAKRFFPNESPLGRQVDLELFGNVTTLQVVGVAGNVHMVGLDNDPGSALYVPHSQQAYLTMHVVIRAEGDPWSTVTGLKTAVRDLDPNLPLSDVRTMNDIIAASLADRRIVALCMTLYALLPLVLAAVGIYAITAYYVARRVHEIGVRMALGADARQVGTLILRQGAVLAGVGLVTGLMGALALSRLLRGMLFGVAPTDPRTYLVVSVFVFLVSVAACVVPTWRAVRSDPTVALRAL